MFDILLNLGWTTDEITEAHVLALLAMLACVVVFVILNSEANAEEAERRAEDPPDWY